MNLYKEMGWEVTVVEQKEKGDRGQIRKERG